VVKGALVRTTQEDLVASVLMGLLVGAYVAYLVFGGFPFARDASDVATLGLVLGFASRWVSGRCGFDRGGAFFAGLAVLVLGVVAHATASDLVLAVFVAANLAVWAAVTPWGAPRAPDAGDEPVGVCSRRPLSSAGGRAP
jgi:hypothetical protein